MAKPPAPIQPLQGLAEAQFLLDVIRDKELLQQVIDDIEEKRQAANELISLIGPAQEIAAMNARIRTNELASEAALEKAKTEAGRLVAAAQSDADGIIVAATELEAGVKQARADAEAARAAADAIVASAQAGLAGMAEREKQLAAKMAEAEQMIAKAEAAKADFVARKAKLAEAMAAAE